MESVKCNTITVKYHNEVLYFHSEVQRHRSQRLDSIPTGVVDEALLCTCGQHYSRMSGPKEYIQLTIHSTSFSGFTSQAHLHTSGDLGLH